MRFILQFLTFLLLVAWILFARYYYVCKGIKNLCGQEEVVELRPQTLQLTYKDEVILQGFEQFHFEQGKVNPDLTSNNNSFLDSLAQYLSFETDQPLKIIGHYRESEKDIQPDAEGFRENMGLARAANIRELLMDRGVAEDRVFLDYQLIQGDTLSMPLTFLLFDEERRPDEYASSQYIFTNMTFSDANFEVDKAEFNPGPQLINYADSVATYITLFPEKRLTIIGHTDSDGSSEYNQDLGLRRAESARDYFKEELGFKPDIIIKSKGKTEPVAPNDTPENKQKNRRVNFQIN